MDRIRNDFIFTPLLSFWGLPSSLAQSSIDQHTRAFAKTLFTSLRDATESYNINETDILLGFFMSTVSIMDCEWYSAIGHFV
jgi:hypothetical protein